MRRETARIRLLYIGTVMILIVLGLLSRRVKTIPYSCGDALWAMVVYCCWRIIIPEKGTIVAAVGALITSFAIEFSQLLSPAWLVKIRSTFVGHMLIGQGFMWSDLLAYAIGIFLIFLITSMIRNR